MTHNDILEYLFLHMQQILTISVLLTFGIVFGNYGNEPTAVIPVTYRLSLVVVSITVLVIVIASFIFHTIKRRRREKFYANDIKSELIHGNETEDKLKLAQHIITILFLFAVVVFLLVKLKQGSIAGEISIAFCAVSCIILVFTIYVYVVTFYNTYRRSRTKTFQDAADSLRLKKQVLN